MIKYLMITCCLFFSINTIADTPKNVIDFASSYQAGHYHPQFTDSEGRLIDDLEKVNILINQVTEEINSGSIDPRVYWLRPVLRSIWLMMYTNYHDQELKKLYNDDYESHPIVAKTRIEASVDYEKALLLNKNALLETRLNEEMISKIYISRSLPARILEMASRERLAIYQKGDIENEWDFYQDFYTEMISDYVRDKDYDNALRILNEYEGIRPGMLNEYLPQLDAKKMEWQKEAIQEVELVEKEEKITQSTQPKKSESVITKEKQQPIVKTEKSPKKESTSPQPNNNPLIISIILAILLLIGFAAVKRKKKITLNLFSR